ncbi:unnamed protein product [Callosobruchus maculatus]|uniref:THAP-type domain-containing protein n=1 Tax=Callosobruchus maculatus TaxID=64391 RepID=A0A653DQR3_CALMS|nr:unnamed protein product [Callosobruchus maculatus]
MCSKLTDAHINPSKINEMKVKICTQVFSHSVGSLMKWIAQWDIKDNNKLPPEAADTADFLLFMDKLFDSFNILRISKPQAKPLKCPVTKKSPHEEFWQIAISIVESMRFFCPDKRKLILVPTLRNLKFTIKGFLYLKRKLLQKKKFKFILTGAFNQDPLENLFSYIRSHGVRCTNPDVSHFVSSFKSLVINNCMSTHSPGSNCQKDITVRNLDTLHNFLTCQTIHASQITCSDTPQVPRQIVSQSRTKVLRCTIVYISGAILKILMRSKTVRNCEECRNHLAVRNQTPRVDDFIEARQYEQGHLSRPGDCLTFLITYSINILFYLIPLVCHYRNISKSLQNRLQSELNFNIMNCLSHNLGMNLWQVIIRCSLFWWCKQVNQWYGHKIYQISFKKSTQRYY